MSGDIARLKAEIRDRRMRSMEVAGDIDRRLRDVKNLLSTYPLAKIKDLSLPLVAQLAGEAKALQEEYLALLDEIEKGERELQG